MSNNGEMVQIAPSHTLLEDLRSILTERKFNLQYETICLKWEVGERIVSDVDFSRSTGSERSFIKLVASALGISNTDAYYCVQFYVQYPELSPSTNVNALNECFPMRGKALSWTYIRDHCLPQHVDKDTPPKLTKRELVEAHSRQSIGGEWTPEHHAKLVTLM
jgi:hypothetical protein